VDVAWVDTAVNVQVNQAILILFFFYSISISTVVDMYVVQMGFEYDPAAIHSIIHENEKSEIPVLQVTATYSDAISPTEGHLPMTRGTFIVIN